MSMIDMHAHWRPAELADDLRARTREPRIVRNDAGAEVLKMPRMGEAPLAEAFDDIDFHLARMDRQGVATSVLSLLGVLRASVPAGSSPATRPPGVSLAEVAGSALPGLTRGELLCEAFEAFRLLLPSAQISFEHAVFLATALARGDQLRLGGCSDCGSLMVTERFTLRAVRCHHCAGTAQSRS